MRYKKKPVEIEAIQFTGWNAGDVLAFMGENTDVDNNGIPYGEIHIDTLEGIMTAKIDDYIIKGVKGEFYPCKPDIFEETYEIILEDLK